MIEDREILNRKISELNAKTENEINKLSYKNKYLVPCKTEIKGEELQIEYDLNNLRSVKEIKSERICERLRFLININFLFMIADDYKIDLCSENIYYDYNFNVMMKVRDIRLKDEIVDYELLAIQYKSLVGYIFSKTYEYNDFFNGGLSLLKKNDITKKYYELNTIEEISNQLLEDLKEKEKDIRENYIEVKKNSFMKNKYSFYGMASVILVLLIYTAYVSIFLIPFKNNVIKASNYFANKQYQQVIESLEKRRGLSLSKESKYQLAYSYVASENLNEKEKKYIQQTLNEKTDDTILDYWISIGNGDYDEAIDLAKKTQDYELILYSLLHKEKSLDDNTKISGEEKQKQKQEISGEIDRLKKELNIESDDTFKKKDVNEEAQTEKSETEAKPEDKQETSNKDKKNNSSGMDLKINN